MVKKQAGYSWSWNKSGFPCILSSYDVFGEHTQTVGQARHPNWVMDYSFTGHGGYRVKDGRMKVLERKPNTLHLYGPNTTYWEHTENEVGMFHSAWIIFKDGDYAGLRSLLGSRDYAQFFDPTEKLGNFITETAKLGQKFGEHGYWRAQALFCHVIHMLLNSEFVSEDNYFIQHQDRLMNVSDLIRDTELYLRENLAKRVTLEELAGVMHMSVSALAHRFRRERGESPIALQNRMRINYAKELVMKGFPLKEVADELGYSDEFHLSKTFKKITGKSPRDFKKVMMRSDGVVASEL